MSFWFSKAAFLETAFGKDSHLGTGFVLLGHERKFNIFSLSVSLSVEK
jgi:hypothetical protein